jgi:peptidoglycan/LPS O-acetylase OafA/YrhL
MFESPRSQASYSASLDCIRWLAALLVVVAHIRHLYFVDYRNVTDLHSIFIKGFYFLTGLGHEAVVIFFVLSGFLVGGGAVKKVSQHRFQLGDYFISRFSRIYTVLLPALLLGGLLDTLGTHFFNLSEIYTNAQKYNIGSMSIVITNNLNLTIFFGNLLNLQNIFVPRFGSNQPLWSLANEWWYYIVFGLLIEAYRVRDKVLMSAGLLTLTLVIFFLLPINIQLWFSIWLLGALAGIISFRKITVPAWASAILIVIALAASRISHNDDATAHLYHDLLRDLLLALAFCIAIILLKNANFNFPIKHVHRELANFSYSLYLIHFPLLVFLTAILYDFLGKSFFVNPRVDSFVLFGLVTIFLYFSAWFFGRCTEHYYLDFASVLKRTLSGKLVK